MSYGFPVTSRPPLRININLLDTSWALWHGELNLVVTWRAPLAYGQYRTCVISQRADTDHRSPLNGISGRRQAERSAGLELGAGAAQRESCCQRRGLGKRDTGERVVYETRRQPARDYVELEEHCSRTVYPLVQVTSDEPPPQPVHK